MSKTYSARKEDIKRQWFLIDAKDKILGRLASRVAVILRGKHKAIFTPHLDSGDGVVIINASKIRVTGRKLKEKIYRRYSGYPGGLREMRLETMLLKSPETVIQLAIRRMLPGGPLGRDLLKKLKVYKGELQRQQAQKPQQLEL